MPIKWDLSRRIVIQDLVDGASKNEILQVFRKFGDRYHERKINKLWVARNPPGLAFLEYRHRRDAVEAVCQLNGIRCCGRPITVKLSLGSEQLANLRQGGKSNITSRYSSTGKSEHRRREKSATTRQKSSKEIEQAGTSAACRRRSENPREQLLICNICYENALKMQPTATICGHIFCSFCIREALKVRRKCPFCVGTIRENDLIPLFVSF